MSVRVKKPIRFIFFLLLTIAFIFAATMFALKYLLVKFIAEDEPTGIEVVQNSPENKNPEPTPTVEPTSAPTVAPTSSPEAKAVSANTSIANQDDGKWNLVLVNKNSPLPEGFSPTLSNIDSSRKFDSRAIGYLNAMLAQMRSDGVGNIWAQSTYRPHSTQINLFNESIQKYKNQGYSAAEAEAKTLQTINRPGTSEHELGLAVDFNYVTNDFKNTAEYAWLIEHAQDYGFILRYPANKVDKTFVNYEPWHWRYVGIDHAKKIKELGFCLEEYIEYLNGGNTTTV
ncbi:MAG: M15 family metallopeptidase [Lachnospiraceae bacterium]|jgi:D-alanyl-D-alanine carboxypeptidase|nr:M15 family metallopeptidase [Lachnospiraceae bacterium]